MLFNVHVGDHVKLKGSDTMGVVVKIEGGIVSVFVKHPKMYTMDTYEHLLEVVSYSEYIEYLNNKPTGNYVIDHAENNGISIEQQIMDMYYEGDISAWMQPIYWETNEFELKSENEKEQYDDVTFLNAEEHEDLNKMYIELALLTGDKEWFNELTNKK